MMNFEVRAHLMYALGLNISNRERNVTRREPS